MGCDIHMRVEGFDGENWKQVVNQVSIPDGHGGVCVRMIPWFDKRNYTLFSLLAGVRERTPIIAPPKGLPSDVSYEVKCDRKEWGSDAHNTSWYDLSDLEDEGLWDGEIELCGETYKYYDICGDFLSFLRQLDDLKYYVKMDKIRIVFWFDN